MSEDKWCPECRQRRAADPLFGYRNRCLICCGDNRLFTNSQGFTQLSAGHIARSSDRPSFYVGKDGDIYSFNLYWSAIGYNWFKKHKYKKPVKVSYTKSDRWEAVTDVDEANLSTDAPEFASPEFADFDLSTESNFSLTHNEYHGWHDPYHRGRTAAEQFGTGSVAFVTDKGTCYHEQSCHLLKRAKTDTLQEISVDYAN